MDEATNPRTLPEAFDKFFIDGTPNPGLSEITSGGDAVAKIEGMQSPGESGATTVDRGDELGAVAYRIDVWAGSQLVELDAFARLLRAAQKRKGGRRQVLELVDLRFEHNGYDRVVVERVSPIKQTAPGKWSLEVAFKQYRQRVARGGPVRPRNAELDASRGEYQAMREEVNRIVEQFSKALDKAG